MWTGIGRGNASLCLSIVPAGHAAVPVVVPLTMRLLVGSVVEIDTLGMMRDLLLMVGLPALAAMALYQFTGGAVSRTLKPTLAPFAKLALLLIILCNATGLRPLPAES